MNGLLPCRDYCRVFVVSVKTLLILSFEFLFWPDICTLNLLTSNSYSQLEYINIEMAAQYYRNVDKFLLLMRSNPIDNVSERIWILNKFFKRFYQKQKKNVGFFQMEIVIQSSHLHKRFISRKSAPRHLIKASGQNKVSLKEKTKLEINELFSF